MGRAVERDAVDELLAEWAREWPFLDTGPAAVVGRLGRLGGHLDASIERTLRPFGLTRAGFDVLAALRRSGAPFRMSQKALMDSLMRTSGTVSFRIDRLERQGLVRREPDPHDGRGALVRLSAKGVRLVESAAPIHLANEERLLAALVPSERATLIALLRKLLVSLEQPPPNR